MEDLMVRLQERIAHYGMGLEDSLEQEQMIEALLEPLRAGMSQSQIEQVQEILITACRQAGKDAFWQGARSMAELAGGSGEL